MQPVLLDFERARAEASRVQKRPERAGQVGHGADQIHRTFRLEKVAAGPQPVPAVETPVEEAGPLARKPAAEPEILAPVKAFSQLQNDEAVREGAGRVSKFRYFV